MHKASPTQSFMMFAKNALRFFAFLSAFWLTGCGGTPEDVMRPTSLPTKTATNVPIIVATTRLASEDPGEMFTGERSYLSYANVTISIPPNHVTGEIEWPSSTPADPERYFATQKAEKVERAQFNAAVSKNIKLYKTNGRVLVFIHGFNTRFDAAVMRLAQIAHDSGAEAVPVLFTWPSRGRLLAYPFDRESNAFSRDGLEKLLKDLVNNPSVTEITILAHSMGNMVALESLRQMAVRDRKLSKKIRTVVLASPDVDVDVARVLIGGMGPNPPQFTLFISRDDRALMVSRFIWRSQDRLGQIDPSQEPYRSQLAAHKNIEVFDLTGVRSNSDNLNHSTFATSPAIVRFVGNNLISGRPLDTERVGLGDYIGTIMIGTTNVIGNAAGAAVSVPLSVIDPTTRENLPDRINAIAP